MWTMTTGYPGFDDRLNELLARQAEKSCVSPEAYNAVMATYKNPVMGLGEAGLVAAIVYHAFNGLRIIMVDFWSSGTKYQKQMLWGVLALWVVVMIPFLIRHLSHVFGG